MSKEKKEQFEIQENGSNGGGKGFLYLAACTANLTAFTCGISFGWTSPIIPKLQSNSEETLAHGISEDDASWIGSLLPIGAAIGPFIAGVAVDKIGRKRTLILSILPIIVAFICSAYAQNASVFYIARFLCGLTVGGVFTVLPMYIGEIATDEVRGALGSLMQLFIVVGILFSYSVGPYVDMRTFNLVATLAPIAFIFIYLAYIPETAQYYLSKNNVDEAEASLAKLRGSSKAAVQNELQAIKATVDESMAKQGGFGDIFKARGLTVAFFLSLSLVTFQQMSGINVILFYTQTIFQATGSDMSPEIATIAIGAVQVLGSFPTPLLVDRTGKRLLLMISGAFMALSLGALGLYFYLKDHNHDVSNISWLPVASLIGYIIFYCLGSGPLPWAIMGELFPGEVKSSASTMTAAWCWLLGFIITKSFGFVSEAIGNAMSFWIFSLCSLISVYFVHRFLPETTGKSLGEIQRILSGGDK